MIFVIIILILIIVALLIKGNKKSEITTNELNNEENDVNDYNIINTPYKKKYLLTKNEWFFYKNLKPLSEKYNLHIIAKIRLADLVEVDYNKTKEFNKYFAKIKSKHIDFALTKPDNLEVKYLIELDDNSHNKQDRKNRDEFLNKICNETGYKLIRTFGDITQIENIIKEDG